MSVWQKSSFSGTGPDNSCVELSASGDRAVRLREGDDPGTVITTTRDRLAPFLRVVKAGHVGLAQRRRTP